MPAATFTSTIHTEVVDPVSGVPVVVSSLIVGNAREGESPAYVAVETRVRGGPLDGHAEQLRHQVATMDSFLLAAEDHVLMVRRATNPPRCE